MNKKPKIVKPQHIWCELFQHNIWVSYGVSSENYKQQVQKFLKFEISKVNGNGSAKHYTWKDNSVIWIWTEEKDISILAHEVFHAVYTILEDKGIKLSNDSNEVYAYMIGFLMRKILNKKEK